MRLRKLQSAAELEALVRDIGFLPFFRGCVDGFSVEALTDNQWWTGEETDPWGWRRVIADGGKVIYSKLFGRKAGFISLEWFPIFANFRRDGYDFDARLDEGLVPARAAQIMRAVGSERLLTTEIKRRAGREGFENAIAQLQTQTYLIISGFGYKKDKHGMPYGWSIGEYACPETVYGAEMVTSRYTEDPQDSFEAALKQAKSLCPDANEEALISLLK